MSKVSATVHIATDIGLTYSRGHGALLQAASIISIILLDKLFKSIAILQSDPYGKSKSLGSGGSMVARLKLKGIDGRAPPEVEPAA